MKTIDAAQLAKVTGGEGPVVQAIMSDKMGAVYKSAKWWEWANRGGAASEQNR